MRCNKCGNEIADGYKFCSACGSPVDEANNASVSNENITMSMFSGNAENDSNKNVVTNSTSDTIEVTNNQVDNSIDNNVTVNQSVPNSNEPVSMNNNLEDNSNAINEVSTDNNVEINGANDNNNTNLGVTNNFVGPSVGSINQDNINSQNVMNTGFNNINGNNISNSKKKKSKLPLIIIIILVLILGVAAVLCYFLLFNKKQSAKNVFIEGLNNLSTANFMTKESTSFSENIKFKIDSTDSSISAISKIVNNLDFVIDYTKNSSEKSLDSNLKINYKGSNALNIGGYLRDKEVYLSFDGLYDNYISIPTDEFSYDTYDINYGLIRTSVINALDKSLKEEYFKKEKETVLVNNKAKEVTANKLVIDSSNVKQISTDFVNELVNDNEFMDYVSKVLSKSKDELKKEMLDSLGDFDNVDNNSVEISIYTTGLNCDFAGVKIEAKSSENYSLKIVKVDSENYDLTVEYNGVSVSGKINYVEKSKEHKINLTFNLGNTSVVVDSDLKESDNSSVKKIDKSKVVDIDDFEENDFYDMMDKAQSNKALYELINDLSNLFGDIDMSSIQM